MIFLCSFSYSDIGNQRPSGSSSTTKGYITSTTTKTDMPTVGAWKNEDDKADDSWLGDNKGMIIGMSIAAIFILCVTLPLGVYLCTKKQKQVCPM